MKDNIFSILFICISFSSISQSTPKLIVNEKQIGLATLKIDVEVLGNRATTTYDMLYYNPADEVLEGELSFPLVEGNIVSRFALDVNGKLREAVVVNDELGRITYEQVVRRGVDPALLERGTGDNYKARIYPIPAKGYKRVLLAYEQELHLRQDGYYYELPLNFSNQLEQFDLKIDVFNKKSQPVIEDGIWSELFFSQWNENYSLSISKENYTPNKSLNFKIPVVPNSEEVFIEDEYFYIFKTLSKKNRLREKPKKISIYWDTSLSMKQRNIKKEFEFIDFYLKYLEEVKICFITFSNEVISEEEFDIADGNWKSLKRKIESVVYDGGSDLNIVSNNNHYSDIQILFSDGISTLSKVSHNIEKPLIAINSVIKSNHGELRNLSELSGGSYINLNTQTAKEGFEAIKYEDYKLLNVTSSDKNLEIYPITPKTVLREFTITGKGLKNDVTLKFNFGFGDEVLHTESLNIRPNENSNQNIKRIWANEKLEKLSLSPRENKEELIKLGTRYGLVTDYTSLIVLENVMDYVTYKITPPEELLEEYNKILAEIENNKGQTENADSLNFLIPVPLNTEAIENEIISRFGSADSNVQRAFSVAEYDMEEELEEVIEVEDMEVLDMDRREEGLPLKFKKYSGSLILKERVTNTKYLEIIRSAKNMEAAYDLYLQLRKEYQDSPAFYKDVSSHFLKEFADRNYSFRILSNIAEMDFDNYELLKVFAYQLQSIDKHELASFIFQRILELRPEDSQSYRDLALSYENIGKYQDALELLNSIITGEIYDGNHRRVFEGVELIAKNEIKSLINKHKSSLDLSQIDKSLLENEAFNIRVIVDWNHNDTDIDLHIIDPNLEECFYSHPKTKIGGELSPDMTQGFGPEEFILRKAVKGNYYIKVKYYADRYQKEENPTFMKVTIFKNYGLKTETKETKIVRLTKKDDEEIIAKIEI